MPRPHSIRAALAVLVAVLPLSAAPPPAGQADAPAPSRFTVFLRASAIGSEDITVRRGPEGFAVASSGRLGAPLDIVTRTLEIQYDTDWKARELRLDATIRGQVQTLRTTIGGGRATSEVSVGGQAPTTVTHATDAEILLPNPFFAPYEAVAARLRTAPAGSTIPAYVVPQAAAAILVGDSTDERIQTARELIETRHTRITITPAAAGAPPVAADVWADRNGRLLRLSVPAQALEVVREDIASAAARQVPIFRPNDEPVKIPSLGFSLAGTLSKPAAPASGRLPAVVLIGGSGPTDRDEFAFGIPIFGQLADAIADAGFITLRYDKRGVGQSGGRLESASFREYADDVRAAVRVLAERKDVDPKRIVAIGHSEGGLVALMAARDKRIAGVVLVATPGVPGADLILEQQQHVLGRSAFSEAEKQQKIDLQKRINQAVITGKGWEDLPAAARRQADNAEFFSILTTDPAKLMSNVRQPILIVQGDLDTQVAPINADRLEALARKRKNAPVQTVRLPGINHLLVAATTGEVDEYGTLKDRRVSAAVSEAIVGWLTSTLTSQ